MITKTFLWTGANGMHARPAGMLVNQSSKFESSITIETQKASSNAKGLFSIMGLGIKEGDKIKIIFEGPDESEAAETITKLLTENLASETENPKGE